jgi:hypothetical protein
MRFSILIAGLFLLTVANSRAEQFLAGFEDVPVMPGIEAVGNAGVAFDSPGGRIVEAYASGSVTRDAVRSYYQAALPQLGWTRTGPLEFSRAGERLSIELLGQSPVTVRFELAPVKN